MQEITETQMRILSHIATFTDEHGYQPSYREIASHFGWTSLGYIAHVIRKMKRIGIVEDSGPRAIVFTGNWRDFVHAATDATELQGSEPTG